MLPWSLQQVILKMKSVVLLLLLRGGRKDTATNTARINEVYKSSTGKVLLSDPRTLCLHKQTELLSQFFAFNTTDGFKTQILWQIA